MIEKSELEIVKKFRCLVFQLLSFVPILISSFILYPSSLSHAAFQDLYWSARVASLGGAYTAVSDDATGIFYNPAALTKLTAAQGFFSYAELFAGLDEVNLSLNQFVYARPLFKNGTLGLGWANFTSADLYREDTVLMSYGRDISELLKLKNTELSAGTSLRYLTRRFVLDARSVGDPVFAGGNRVSNVTFDFHVHSVPSPQEIPGLSLGISLKSINRPDVGFKDTERLPTEAQLGMQYRWRNFSLPLDVSVRSGEIDPRVGLEIFAMKDRLAFRVGSDTFQFGSGFGYEHSVSGRFSLVFDYAFLWPLHLEGTVGSHRATLGIKF